MPRKNVSKQIEKILDKADKNNFNSVAEEKISNILAVEKKQFVDSGKLLYINESGTIATSTIKVDKIEFIKNLISPIKTQLKDLTLYDISTYIKGKTISEKYYNFKNINKIYKELSTELKHNRRTNEISDGNQNKFIVNGVYDGDIFIEGKLRNSESIFVHNTYTSLDTNTYEAHIMRLTRKPPKEIEIIQYPKISFTSKSSSNISNYDSNRAFDGQTTGSLVWISLSLVYIDGQYSPTGTYYLDPDYRGEYIIIDLGEETIINQVKMYGRNGADAERHPRNYRIYGSNDQNDYNNPQNGNWEQIFEKINDTPDTVPSSYPTVDEFFDNFTTYRYYALVTNKVYSGSGNNFVELLEWELFHVKIPGNDPPSLPLVLKYPPAPLPTNNHNHLSTERFSTTTLEGQEYGNGEYIVSWSTHSTDNYRSTTPGVFSDEPATGGNAHAWQAYQYYQTQYKTELGNGLSDVLGDWLRLKLPIKLKLSYIEFYITENEKYKQPAYTVFGTNDNGVTWKNILEVSILDIYGADGTGGTYPVTLD